MSCYGATEKEPESPRERRLFLHKTEKLYAHSKNDRRAKIISYIARGFVDFARPQDYDELERIPT
jgi:hypothetical protein